MRQVLQNLRSGLTEIADVPCPSCPRGGIVVRSSISLVSAGTERMLVDFGRAGLVQKAIQQPDKVKMVLAKIKTDGLLPTLDAVFNKLDQPLPLGYCNVGVVAEVGAGVSAFSKGDRVVSNGRHAEYVAVPQNLSVRVPDAVADEEASFTVLGAIALQGVRLVQPTLGESVFVTGLGLIGLMTVQLLRAHGCRVLAADFDSNRLALAKQFGAETVDLSLGQDPVASANLFSRGRGVDAVIITASTKSNEPVHQAALMCRKRGRIVLVGVTGLSLSRADFYEKELTFQVSCSYGPGRYDPSYEETGIDYPFGFVRWTEQRNFEAVLDMMADSRLDVAPLISHRFEIGEAEAAYELVSGSASASLGILLQYPDRGVIAKEQSIQLSNHVADGQGSAVAGAVSVGFLGAGNYATAVLIPAFKAAGACLKSVACSAGVSGVHAGRKYGFQRVTTDSASLFSDEDVQAVVVSTRHDSHARFVVEAIESGKHVFVEKPLCLTTEQLNDIESALAKVSHGSAGVPLLMVGFNRRFSPHIQKMKALLSSVIGPKSFVMTVNAGAIPANHWTQDLEIGGGRVLGEACHFIDLLRFLVGHPIVRSQHAGMSGATQDTAAIQLTFADGSIGSIQYYANGNKAFPKERLEVFASGGVLQLNNFRTLVGFGWPGFRTMRLWRQDKGQRACAQAFLDAIAKGQPSPIPLAELLEVSRVTIELARTAC